MCAITAWLPDSPWRSPAWRWLRASWLVERRKRIKQGFDDDGVRRARSFIARGGNRVGDATVNRAERADPSLAHALRLHLGDPHTRWRLEGYLLTTEPLEVVAERCLLPLPTVETFHDLFFDVRGRREATDWIFLRAIGAGPWNGFHGDYPGRLCKAVAFTGGALMLDLAIAITTNTALPTWVRDLFRGWSRYEIERLMTLSRFTFAAMRATTNSQFEAILVARERVQRLDRKVFGSDFKVSDMFSAMSMFLKSHAARPGKRPSRRKQKPGTVETGITFGRASQIPAASPSITRARPIVEV